MAVPRRRPTSSFGKGKAQACASCVVLGIITVAILRSGGQSSSSASSPTSTTSSPNSLLSAKRDFSVSKTADSTDRDASLAVDIMGQQQNAATVIVRGKGTYKLDHPKGRDGTNVWSEFGQDEYVREYFSHKENQPKVFVEVGGFDGELHSNTLLLERNDHWTGILVEANPYAFARLQAKDRNCWMVQACLSDDLEQEMEFLVAGRYTTSTTFVRPGDAPKLRGRADLAKHERDGEGLRVAIPCLSLSYIVQKTLGTTPRHIDYLSMDVEGAELFSIESVMMDVKEGAVTIDLMSIELEGNDNADDIRKIMTQHGYKEVSKSGIDVFFARKTQ